MSVGTISIAEDPTLILHYTSSLNFLDALQSPTSLHIVS